MCIDGGGGGGDAGGLGNDGTERDAPEKPKGPIQGYADKRMGLQWPTPEAPADPDEVDNRGNFIAGGRGGGGPRGAVLPKRAGSLSINQSNGLINTAARYR